MSSKKRKKKKTQEHLHEIWQVATPGALVLIHFLLQLILFYGQKATIIAFRNNCAIGCTVRITNVIRTYGQGNHWFLWIRCQFHGFDHRTDGVKGIFGKIWRSHRPTPPRLHFGKRKQNTWELQIEKYRKTRHLKWVIFTCRLKRSNLRTRDFNALKELLDDHNSKYTHETRSRFLYTEKLK